MKKYYYKEAHWIELPKNCLHQSFIWSGSSIKYNRLSILLVLAFIKELYLSYLFTKTNTMKHFKLLWVIALMAVIISCTNNENYDFTENETSIESVIANATPYISPYMREVLELIENSNGEPLPIEVLCPILTTTPESETSIATTRAGFGYFVGNSSQSILFSDQPSVLSLTEITNWELATAVWTEGMTVYITCIAVDYYDFTATKLAAYYENGSLIGVNPNSPSQRGYAVTSYTSYNHFTSYVYAIRATTVNSGYTYIPQHPYLTYTDIWPLEWYYIDLS